jgi:RimJ/RimL family protein N-acetyltransferase
MFRSKGLQTALSLARLDYFQELDYKRAIAYIEVNNIPSLTVWRKMGAQIVDYIDFKRILIWRRTRCGRFRVLS